MTNDTKRLEIDQEFLPDLARLATAAIDELEKEIANDGHGIDALDFPFVTGVEHALGKLLNSIVDYGKAAGLRLSEARQQIIDAKK